MTYNFRLLWRMTYRSLFKTSETPGRLTRKRITFLALFYIVWPLVTIFTWICFGLDDIFFPAYKKQPVEKPLFIISNFRSGSTFLHRMLSHDTKNFTSLRTWDIYITPSVTQRKIVDVIIKLDQLIGGPIRRLILAIDRAGLQKVDIHPISFLEPEEDENILLHNWSSFLISFLFPFLDELPPYQYFDRDLPTDEKDKVLSFYKSMLQRHLYATGSPHFVSKNPSFSAKIATLKEFFPDARIIYLARNPLEMLPSTVSWLNYAWSIFSEPAEKYIYIDEICEFSQYWYRYPLNYLDENPSANHLILSYEDLINDPIGVIRSFYEQFGYTDHHDLDEAFMEGIKATEARRSAHQYSFEEMGFTREQIIATYADIFERFGFDKREPISEPFERIPEAAD
ncbi:MAG: sulfotransferase [Anaerolineae bacterium]|nr:sulfotransferase [Anaerolineae bacterium]MBT7071703.1 sulfotransferase [Anaerolineae bacterium]MBT7325229.1 sulfotransferase [Anaerolineae bacterium]